MAEMLNAISFMRGMVGSCITVIGLVLGLATPGRCDQSYNSAYNGSGDLVQLTAEVLDGDQVFLYNTDQDAESFHWFQLTAGNSGGEVQDFGSFSLWFNGSLVDVGSWHLHSTNWTAATDHGELSGTVRVPLGYTSIQGITDDEAVYLAVTDTHTYAGGI
jgi:hypothetical protein